MNEQSQQEKQTPHQNDVEPEASSLLHPDTDSTKAGFFSSITITHLTMLVMAVVFSWQWLEERRIINDLQHQLAAKIDEMVGGSKKNRLWLSKNQSRINELDNKVAALEKRKGDGKPQRSAQDGWYNDLVASREETVIAEVEQMLLNADQQLQLSENVRAALIVMQSADEHLQRMNQPAFKGLSRAIIRDMDNLRALPSININSINTKLNELIDTVDKLQIASLQRVENEPVEKALIPEDEALHQKLRREIWQELKQLVQIENTGMDKIPLLPPNQQFFLRENLKLRLMSARIALLTRDEKVYKQDMEASLSWVQRYFDTKSMQGLAMLEGLEKLSSSKIYVPLPDIGASLLAIRNYRLTREKAGQ